ncbi:MAG TPA: hypothetical protein VNF93_02265 [Buchnera sp. (in: enterobacteria)]|nr:hypothetical protein [Buchnera sp. (in: enterobacteria)]
MKKFNINENQVQQIASILLEFPAKNVLNALDILRNLPLIDEQKPD